MGLVLSVCAVSIGQQLGDISLVAGETLFIPLDPLFEAQEIDLEVQSEVPETAFLLPNSAVLLHSLPTTLTFAPNEASSESFVLYNSTYLSEWTITAVGLQRRREVGTVGPIAGLKYVSVDSNFFVLYWTQSPHGTEFYFLSDQEDMHVADLSLTRDQTLLKVVFEPRNVLALLVQEQGATRLLVYDFDIRTARADLKYRGLDLETGEEIVDVAGGGGLNVLTTRAVYRCSASQPYERLLPITEPFDAIVCVNLLCYISNAHSSLYILQPPFYSPLLLFFNDINNFRYWGLSVTTQEVWVVVANYQLRKVRKVALVPEGVGLQNCVFYLRGKQAVLVVAYSKELRVYSFTIQEEMMAVKGLDFPYRMEICGIDPRNRTDRACQRSTISPLPRALLYTPLLRSQYLLNTTLPSPHLSLSPIDSQFSANFNLPSLFSGSNLHYSVSSISAAAMEISTRLTDPFILKSSILELQDGKSLLYSCFNAERDGLYLGSDKEVIEASFINGLRILAIRPTYIQEITGCVYAGSDSFWYSLLQDCAFFYPFTDIERPTKLPYTVTEVKASDLTLCALSDYAVHCYFLDNGNWTTVKPNSDREIIDFEVNLSTVALLTPGLVHIFTVSVHGSLPICVISVPTDTHHIALSTTHLIAFNGSLHFYSSSPCLPNLVLKTVHLSESCTYGSMTITRNELYLNCGSYLQVVDIEGTVHSSLVARMSVNKPVVYAGSSITLLMEETSLAVNVTTVDRQSLEMEVRVALSPFSDSVQGNITVVASNQVSIATTVTIEVHNSGLFASVRQAWRSTAIETYGSTELSLQDIFVGVNLHYSVVQGESNVTFPTTAFHRVCSLPCTSGSFLPTPTTHVFVCFRPRDIDFFELNIAESECSIERRTTLAVKKLGALHISKVEAIGKLGSTIVSVVYGMWETVMMRGAIVLFDVETQQYRITLLDDNFSECIVLHRNSQRIQLLVYGETARLYEIHREEISVGVILHSAQPGVAIVSVSRTPSGHVYCLTAHSLLLYTLSPPTLLSTYSLPPTVASLSHPCLQDSRLFACNTTHLSIFSLPSFSVEIVPLPCTVRKFLVNTHFIIIFCMNIGDICAMNIDLARYEVIWRWVSSKASNEGEDYIVVRVGNGPSVELWQFHSPTVVIERPKDGSKTVELILRAWNEHSEAEVRVTVHFQTSLWVVGTVAVVLALLGTVCLHRHTHRRTDKDIEMTHLV